MSAQNAIQQTGGEGPLQTETTLPDHSQFFKLTAQEGGGKVKLPEGATEKELQEIRDRIDTSISNAGPQGELPLLTLAKEGEDQDYASMDRAEKLYHDLGPDFAQRWIMSPNALAFTSSSIIITTGNDMSADALMEKDRQKVILDAAYKNPENRGLSLETITNKKLHQRLVPTQQGNTQSTTTKRRKLRQPSPKIVGNPLNPIWTFEQFLTQAHNKRQAAQLESMGSAEYDAPLFPQVLIKGERGIGKTHLAQAVGHRLTETTPGSRVVFIEGNGFAGEYVRAMKAKTLDQLETILATADLLIIDDIHELHGEANQQTLKTALNTRYARMLPVIATTNYPLSAPQFKKVSLDIRSRLGEFLPLPMVPPNETQATKIVQHFLETRLRGNLTVRPGTAQVIAEATQESLAKGEYLCYRNLLSSTLKAMGYVIGGEGILTPNLAMKALQENQTNSDQENSYGGAIHNRLERQAKTAAAITEVPYDLLANTSGTGKPSRKGEIPDVRRATAYLLKQYESVQGREISDGAIGSVLGISASAVNTGRQKIQERLEAGDPTLTELVRSLEQGLGYQTPPDPQ
jgi:chromosomal replication initiation ATPase DnaA